MLDQECVEIAQELINATAVAKRLIRITSMQDAVTQ